MGAMFGQCPKCPKNSPSVRLYGVGVCSYHLGHPDEDQSGKKQPKADDPKGDRAKVLNKFFADQIKILPSFCENCGKRIIFTAAGKKAHICHILPKRLFESVMVHPENRWFGCINCHGDYDNKGWSFAVTMKVWPICLERFQRFMMLIKDTELRHLPAPFMELRDPA